MRRPPVRSWFQSTFLMFGLASVLASVGCATGATDEEGEGGSSGSAGLAGSSGQAGQGVAGQGVAGSPGRRR